MEDELNSHKFQTLTVINGAINQIPDLKYILQTALSGLAVNLGINQSEIWLFNQQTNQLHLSAFSGLPDDFNLNVSSFAPGIGLPGITLTNKTYLLIPDLKTNPQYMRQRAINYNLDCALSIPLFTREVTVGVLNLFAQTATVFTDTIIKTALTIGAILASVIQTTRLFETERSQRQELETIHQLEETTERKRTEIALHESEEKYRILIENSHDAIFLIYNSKFEVINRKFHELFGETTITINDNAQLLFGLIAPRDRPAIQNWLVNQTSGTITIPRQEFSTVNHAGKEIQVELTISSFPYKDGAAIQGIIRDLTEQKIMQDRLLQVQRINAVGRLAGGIAHDFNNILTTITGLISLSLDQLETTHPIYKDLKIVQGQANRAAILVEQLLAFSRRQAVKVVPVDLNQVISKLIYLLQKAVGENINFKTVLSPELKLIHGDTNALEQILTSLCFNARDAMPEGGKLTIITQNLPASAIPDNPSLNNSDQYVQLIVSDTGHGMDSETLSQIFEPFFTTKNVGQGSGLGLAMVLGLVKQMNGFIEAESIPGQGSTFTMYFPVIAQPNITVNSSAIQMPPGTENILLVEDDAVVCTLVQRILLQIGYTVKTATNGKEALTLLQKNQFKADMIISDLVMPEMGGQELLRQVTILYPQNPPKFLFMSGYEADTLLPALDKNLAIGQTLLIHKPFSPLTLTSKIRRILDQR